MVSVPSKVRMRSTTKQFAQCYLILAHFQHSKFNTVYIYRTALSTLGTLHCSCVCIVAQLHALRAQQQTFAQCIIFLREH